MGCTLVLEVPEDVYEPLMKTAKQIGQPPEALAIQWLANAARNLAVDPLERFIGAFSSNVSDWADEHDKYIGKSIMETMRRVEPKDNSDV